MIVRLSDYMPLARSGDATPAVLEALIACRREKNATLLIDPGVYHFRADDALTREYYVSNNDGGRKAIAFPLIGFDGLTVDGRGAELIFHGSITPFVVDESKNIVIRNLSVDYPRPYYSQARVLASGNGCTDLSFPPDYPCRVENGKIVFFDPNEGWDTARLDHVLVTEFDERRAHRLVYLAYWDNPEKAGFLSGLARLVRAEQLPDGVIRLHGADGHTPGAWWLATHGSRHNPGFVIQKSRDVTLEDITLYHTASMGVVGQLSENITLRRVNTALRPGRLLSVNADATHFVHCTGTVLLEDCHLCHMMDDGGNFHGTYTLVDRILGAKTLVARIQHAQQQGVQIYRPGDVLALVDRSSLRRLAEITVDDVLLINERLIRLTFEEPLPACAQEGLAIENFTRMPEVILRGCEVAWNRPRGFLISTCRRALIENCVFSNMNQAIHLTGDANSWFESGPVRDLTVRNCYFRDSAYTDGPAIRIDPAVVQTEDNYYHGSILNENNLFESDVPRILYARNTESIVFRGNAWRHVRKSAPDQALHDRHADADRLCFRRMDSDSGRRSAAERLSG